MVESIYKVFEYIDSKIGPDKKLHKKACFEGREMLMECVLQSDCMKNSNNFKYCIQEGINKECKALRYDYFLCRRGQVFWEKSITKDPV